jgi:spermidine synthase
MTKIKQTKILTGFTKIRSTKGYRYNKDALHFGAKSCTGKNLMVIIDFPDPSNYSLGKLYAQLYATVQKSLHPDAVNVIQNDFFALFCARIFWCIN